MAGTSYTRQSTITDGNLITASLFNNEYNQLLNAFVYSSTGTTGHTHDGTAGQGGAIGKIGDQDFKNKIEISTTNNRIECYVEVGGSPVEQLRIQDGAIVPVTDSDIDLGTTSLRFKDAFVDSLTVTGVVTATGFTIGSAVITEAELEILDGKTFLDEDDLVSDSATGIPSQQSVKAYVDAQVTAQDLDLTDGTTSISIDLDSEALSVLGGTGITSTASGNGVTLAIDSTVATLTGSQTLTNKTLTAPDINTPDIDGGTIDGTIIGGTTAAAGSFTTVDATGNITVGGTVDGRDVAADGTKLDGIETAATADQTDAEIRAAVEAATDSNVFTDADHSKLNAIEALADVTDTTNVTAAGALMDSELTSIASVKALDQGVATTDSPTFAGLTTSADVSFGDNDKAIFGAGSDLQIYHDGTNSYIDDSSGTGRLILKTDYLEVQNAAGNEAILGGIQDGAVSLFYDGNTKLVTTATGIDVTGTATMNGLTVANSTTNAYKAAIVESAHPTTDAGLLFIGGGDYEFGLQQPYNAAGLFFYDRTNNVERMRIDSAGRVGIGTSSIDNKVNIQESALSGRGASNGNTSLTLEHATDTGIQFFSATQTQLRFGDAASTAAGSIIYEHDTDKLRLNTGSLLTVATGGAERMRIDSSGNLLVGKTAASSNTVGFETSADGTCAITRSNGQPLLLNRQTSDGDIILFRKDGTSVGSIGAQSGRLTVGSNSAAGVRFDGTQLVPMNGASISDNTITLGDSGFRFKDLYLAGVAKVDSYVSLGNNGYIRGDASGELRFQGGSSATTFYDSSNTVERMRIDSAGNVGIGVVPESWTYFSPIQAKRSSFAGSDGQTGVGYNWYFDGAYKYIANDYALAYQQNATSGVHTWSTAASGTADNTISWSESMRIDSSGNLLVGTTDDVVWNNSANSAADNGHNLRDDGRAGFAYYNATANSNATVNINRTGSEGDLIRLFKSGTNVGSIGTNVGRLSIGSGDTGVLFAGDIDAIYPANGIAARDSAIDLGVSGARFKDLYLSGAVNLTNSTTTAFTQAGSNMFQLGTNSADPTVFYTSGAERMRITSSGNVVIGSTSDARKFQVVGGANASETILAQIRSNFTGANTATTLRFGNSTDSNAVSGTAEITALRTSTSGTTDLFFRTSNGVGVTERMRIDSAGNLLVGRTSAGNTGNGHSIRGGDSAVFSRDATGESMQVCRNASAGDLVRFYCNGVDKGSIDFDGGNIISYTTSSDQRLKENITDADDAGSKVDSIQVRKFDWKADGSHQDYGMIAQELQAVAPEAVSGDADSEDMMGVDYSKLVPMLVKEIQSLRNRVAQLEE